MATIRREVPGEHMVTVDYPYAEQGVSLTQAQEIADLAHEYTAEEVQAANKRIQYLGSTAVIDVQRRAVRVTKGFGEALMTEATDLSIAAARKVAANTGIEFKIADYPDYHVRPVE